MSEVVLPPWIIPETETHEWLDDGSAVFRAAFAPGLAQRQSYGGLRLKISRRHTVRAEEKAQLLAALYATRGQYNALRTRVHFALRGSFDTTQVISNNTFANGTTGWTAGGGTTLSVADRILRMLRASQTDPFASQAITVSQYVPYVARVANVFAGADEGGVGVSLSVAGTASSLGQPLGLKTVSQVSQSTSGTFYIDQSTGAGPVPGSFHEASYASLSRCIFVDNGPNAHLYSNELDNAAWSTLNASISVNTTAPDGNMVADVLVENSAAGNHYLIPTNHPTRSSASEDLCVFGYFSRYLSSTRDIRLVIGSSASNYAQCVFNLGTGVAGTPTVVGTPTNARAYIKQVGSYYACYLVATCAASTQIYSEYDMIASGASSYTGDGTSGIAIWRAGCCRGGLPTRGADTAASAVASGAAQTGTALHVKGLTVSSSGLLLPGDWIEVNGELKQVTAALNSDAAGLGYLNFEPALVRSPADNDPIIINEPMGKFLVSNIKIDNEFGTQARVSYDLEHIYE